MASYSLGILPTVWAATEICLGEGEGVVASPYNLVKCLAELRVTATSGNENEGITVSGFARAGGKGQEMRVWADACNSAGQCVRKEYGGFDVASSGTAQEWTLSWEASELPAGTYNGTVWVGLTVGNETRGYETITAESDPVNFTIAATTRTFPVTVIENQGFSLDVGVVSNYDLGTTPLPVTSNGVTASNAGGKLVLASTTGLASNATATFGNTKFEMTVIEQPQVQVLEVSFE
jgi:hypothetical protein